MKNLITPLIGALALCLNGCGTQQPEFVRVENGRFAGAPAYFVGANFWYGALLATEGPGGDRDRLCHELDSLKAMGVTNLRILVGSDGNTGVVSKVEPILQTAPGVYNDKALDGLDYLMDQLARRDMRAVLYLTNAWEWSGGYCQYLEWSGHGTYPIPQQVAWQTFVDYVARFHEAEATDSCKVMLENHIRHIVTRTNRYTGRPYRDDPTIFSWQLANEPRPFAAQNKERFYEWVSRTAKLIKELDPNHMVSTGSEGEVGCERDPELWRRIHAIPEIDYVNIHIWPANWGWIRRDRVEEDLPAACEKTDEYIRLHIEIARELQKPLVIEEFGYPRDGFRFEPDSPATARDAYYRHVFDHVVRSAAAGDILAGCNFWGWGGQARPPHLRWKPGDPYCGDPAQEEQGLYSVFDCDHAIPGEIAQTNRTLALYARSLDTPAGNRSPAAQLRLLREVAANDRILFGQQDFGFYGCHWAYEPGRSDVEACCAEHPALLGCDLGGIELQTERNLDGVPFDTMRREIVRHHERGGLTTVSWHPRNPLTGGDAWDTSDPNTVRSVLPGGAKHAEFLGWIDLAAGFLNSLRTADGTLVPVLFRPWHEHTGSWFWWGEKLCTSQEYRALWKMTVARLREQGVRILTVYSPNPVDDENGYLERYPGDAWVDVLGLDAYHAGDAAGFTSRLGRSLAVMERIAAQNGKPCALTETGQEGIPTADWWTSVLLNGIGKHRPSYLMVWRNALQTEKPGHYYAPYPGHPSEADFIQFHALDRTLFVSGCAARAKH